MARLFRLMHGQGDATCRGQLFVDDRSSWLRHSVGVARCQRPPKRHVGRAPLWPLHIVAMARIGSILARIARGERRRLRALCAQLLGVQLAQTKDNLVQVESILSHQLSRCLLANQRRTRIISRHLPRTQSTSNIKAERIGLLISGAVLVDVWLDTIEPMIDKCRGIIDRLANIHRADVHKSGERCRRPSLLQEG